MPGEFAYLIDPNGQTVQVPAEEAMGARQLGYVPASQKQIDDLLTEDAAAKKYGTTGQAAIAGVEHAASALTFGLSDVAERGLGISTPEAMAAREKFNPVASGVGTAVGVALPLLATLGTAAPAEAGALGLRGAAELAAPSLISKAGQAVTRGAAAVLPEASGLAGRLATKAIASGAGSAIEGAAYGAGQLVHEAALGDHNITAQSALMTVGIGGLLGGALGAGGGLFGGLIKEATAGEIGGKLADWLGEVEGNRNIKAAGAIQGDISRATKQIGRSRLNKIGQEMGERGLVGPLSTPTSTLEKANELLRSSGEEIGGILKATDAKAIEGAAPKITEVADRARKEILEPLAKNPLQQEAAQRFGTVLDGYVQKFEGGMGLEDLHGVRKQISEALYGLRGNQDPFANSFKDALHDLRGVVSDEIEAGLKRAGETTDAWKAANRSYEVASKAAEFAQKGIDRAHGNNLVSLTEGLGALGGGIGAGPLGGLATGAATAAVRRHGAGLLGAGARGLRKYLEGGGAESVAGATSEMIAAERSAGTDVLASQAVNAPETIAALSTLERNNQAVASKIDSLASTLVRGGSKAADVGRHEVLSGMPKMFGEAMEDQGARHMKRIAEVNRLAQDPLQMQAALEKQTDGFHEHAPNTAQAMQIASARAVSFLNSKAPKPPQLGPLGPEWKPSQAEISTFNRYFEAVNRPSSILKQAAAGTLTPEGVEAVRTVYPELFAKIQGAIVEKLAQHPGKIPYQNKLMLGMILGQDMDGTMGQSSIAAIQASYARPSGKSPMNQPGGGHLKSTLGGLGKLTVSNRMLTPMQAAGRRGMR